jgi:carbonic anhydrase
MIINENVTKTLADIKKVNPTLKKMHKDGKIKISGAAYHMKTGQVIFH